MYPSHVLLTQSHRLVTFIKAYIIHTKNFNNTSLIIICTDFWPLIDERDTYSKFNEIYNVGSCSLILLASTAILLMNFCKTIPNS